jgi:putative endonuclease
MPFTYILKCSDGTFYTGSTWNLDKRIWDHMEGLGSKYTKRRLPVELVYCEEFKRIDEAYQRERQIHGWSRKKKIALIEGNYDGLVKYSRKKRE